MRLSATGFTLPWQLVAAQEPGPIYFCASLPTFGVCANVLEVNARNAAQTVSAERPADSVKKCMVEVRKESLRLYRSTAQEVNDRGSHFAQHAPKSQRSSIYLLLRGD